MKNLFENIKEYIIQKRDRRIVGKTYEKFFHKKINWDKPITYSEKIQVYKLAREMEKLWPYADKWEARKIVKRKVGPQILNKVYGTWKDASKINFNKLPKRFILKPNHGSGWYVIVKDKKTIDETDVRNKLNNWLKINYYSWWGRERQYKLIKPRIIAEKYLEDKNGELLDYKFFCFHGKVHFIHFTIGRFTGHRRNFYDRNWKKLPFKIGSYPTSSKRYPKPKNLQKMIEIAEKISSDLKHARVDLYNLDGRIYFGEVTLCPGNGMELFHPAKYDRYYGSVFNL